MLRIPSPRNGSVRMHMTQKAVGDSAFRVRHHLILWSRVVTSAVSEDDFGIALCLPAMGWPAYEVIRGIDRPGPHLGRKIFGEGTYAEDGKV